MRARLIAVVAVVTLVAVACSNAGDDKKADTSTTTTTTAPAGGGSTVDQPGVTEDTIRVGGVVSKTNAVNGPYGSAFEGVKAYFNKVNASGGIYGRELELVSERDDQMAQNQEQVEAMLAQDNVFAVAPVATIFSFSGAEALVTNNVPTFGWNLNEEFTGHPNMFGSNSGALCLGCVASFWPFMAQELNKKKVGVLAYAVSNSSKCAEGIEKSFEEYPSAEVAFLTKSASFGQTDFSVEVGQMKSEGVDLIMTCMDTTAVLNLAKEMRKQDLKATQYLPNGYDAELVKANAEFFEGSYVGVPFAPFETKPKPKGLVEFNTWMDKAGYAKNEVAMNGWISAYQLHLGLQQAGPDFTRQKVIDGLNKLTDVTADGLIPTRNWTTDHEITHVLACTAWVKIEDGKFVPVWKKPGKPFQCIEDQPAKLPTTATYE